MSIEYKNGDRIVKIHQYGEKSVNITGPNIDFPESIDLKVTNYCPYYCSFCYQNSTFNEDQIQGADPLFVKNILSQMHPGTEVAIGGGAACSWHHIYEILKFGKDNDLIMNMTVSFNELYDNRDYIKSLMDVGLINGLGVSIPKFKEEYFNKIKDVNDILKHINTVAHMIVGISDPIDIVAISNLCKKVLFLGYKDCGRANSANDYSIKNYQELLKACQNNFKTLKECFDLIAFDNLAIKQLAINPRIYKCNYMGEDGTFSFYIDAVEKQFALNSFSEFKHNINNLTLVEMFNYFKKEVNYIGSQYRGPIFETNSSSSHALAIQKNMKDPNYIPRKISLYLKEYGWEIDQLFTINEILSYLWTQLCYNCINPLYTEERDSNAIVEENPEIYEFIERVKELFPLSEISFELPSKENLPYIDHQSILTIDEVFEVLNNKDFLLYGAVFTGNDNVYFNPFENYTDYKEYMTNWYNWKMDENENED